MAILHREESYITAWEDSYDESRNWIDINEDSIAAPWDDWMRAELSLQKVLMHMALGEEANTGISCRALFRQINRVTDYDPTFAPITKCRGMANVLVGIVRLRYAWIMEFLGYEGSISQGIALLDEAARGDFRQEEAGITLALCHAYLLSDRSTAIEQLQPLAEQMPGSKLVAYFMAHLWLKNHGADSAAAYISQIERLDSTDAYLGLPHIDYWKAEIALQRANYSEAIEHYDAEHHTDEQGFVKDRWYKSGLCHYLAGNQEKADAMLQKCYSTGNTSTSPDRYAASQAQSGLWPHKLITKARHASDGGYLERAEQLLASVDSTSLSKDVELLEYHYRLARLYDLQKMPEKALATYDKVIAYSNSERLDSYYFAASANYYAGRIAQQLGDPDLARSYYKAVFNYSDNPYSHSLENKALLAVKRMDER